jgi:hypothetical protein
LSSTGAALAQPVVSSLFGTNSGPASGNTTIIILGSGFTGATQVQIGGTNAASFNVNSDTSITALTGAFTTAATPTVTGISPNHGATAGGNGLFPATITGTNFVDTVNVSVTTGSGTGTGTGLFTYNNVVTGVAIGGTTTSNFTVTSATQISVVQPPGIPGVADVVVSVVGGGNGVGSKLYTYTDGGPGISNVGPDYGLTQGGNSITITGSNFVPGTYVGGATATTVTIDGNPATNVVVTSNVSLTATVPAATTGPGSKTVVVSTVAGTASSGYLYIAPANPTVTAISPTSGSTVGGTQVSITGTNFTGATSVTIGGVPVNAFQINAPGQITTATPAHAAAGQVDVVVTVVAPNGGGTFTGTGTNLFTYVTPAPTVNSISPNVGTTAGGTPVTITGTNFAGTSSVVIGGVPATSIIVNPNGSSLTAVTGAGAAATDVNVVVTATSGVGTGVGLFTYGTPPPTVASVSPGGGSVNGGTNVTITGTGFTGVTGVTFGGNPATNVVFVNATTVTATTPAHGAGAANVSVTTPAGTGTGGGLFTYGAAAPTVTSISPNSGTTQGNNLVTITGTGFSGTPLVSINGVAASNVILVNATTITALAPPGSGTNDPVVVTTSIGPSAPANIYSYIAPPPPAAGTPTITGGGGGGGISPSSGPTSGGTIITITGTNLTGTTGVTIGGVPATLVTVVNGTTVTAKTPPGTLGPKDVVVTTPGGTATSTGGFTYVALPPTVTAVNPSTGTSLGGTSVTITGTNFTGATAVTFGGTNVSSYTVVNATTITAKTPAHAGGLVNVAVTTGAGTSPTANLFTYVAPLPPTVTAISPNHGDVGGNTAVTITGTNFTNVTSVTIGGSAVQFQVVVNTTTITATTPAHAAGITDVVVVTTAGTSTGGTGLYTYTAKPAVTSVSPNMGPGAGGTTVTITGTNLTGTTSVVFGTTPATTFTVNGGGTSITATSPPGVGTVNVTVTTPGGTSPVGTVDQFTYNGVPTVTSVSPDAGPVGGATQVTITGTNFTSATVVKFGGTNATSFSVNTSTSITAISPPGTGTVDVTVTTPGGTSATNPADKFAFGKAATTLTLTSTPNPSLVGQPVTFTARVTGNSPTGTVTFTYNNATIGTAALVSGVATFTIATLPAGSDPVSASYPGDANNAPDPQMVIQVVQSNSDSARLHEVQVAVMPVVANISGQAISGAIDSAIGVGLGGCPQLLTPSGNGFTYYFDGCTQQQPQASSYASGDKISSSTQALVSPSGTGGGNSVIDDEFKALGFANDGSAQSYAKANPQQVQAPRDWLAWVDVRGAGFGRSGTATDLTGTQVNVTAGITRRILPDFVVGALGGYENFDFSSQTYNGVLKGSGYTVGAYTGLKLGASIRLDAAVAWSDITASDTSGTANGNFTGTRWLASGGLTGTYNLSGLAFEPSARVYGMWEQENSYTDSLGNLQAAHDFDTGRASGGMKVSYPIPTGLGTLAPYAGLYGDYYFSKDNAAATALTPVLLLQGWGARATGGVTATFAGGPQLSVGGEYSGIGNDTHIWTFLIRGNVPF